MKRRLRQKHTRRKLVALIAIIAILSFVLLWYIDKTSFSCTDKVFRGKGYSACGYGIGNSEALPKNIQFEADGAGYSTQTYQITGKIITGHYPCPDANQAQAEPMQQLACGDYSYLEIATITPQQ